MITFILNTLVTTLKDTISIIPSRLTFYRRMLSEILDYNPSDPRRLAKFFYVLGMLISRLLFDFHFLQLIVTLSLPPLGTSHLVLFAFNLFLFNFLLEASGLIKLFNQYSGRRGIFVFSVFYLSINSLRVTFFSGCDPVLLLLISPLNMVLWLNSPWTIGHFSRTVIEALDYFFPIITYPLYFTVDSIYLAASAILGLFDQQRPIDNQTNNTMGSYNMNHDSNTLRARHPFQQHPRTFVPLSTIIEENQSDANSSTCSTHSLGNEYSNHHPAIRREPADLIQDNHTAPDVHEHQDDDHCSSQSCFIPQMPYCVVLSPTTTGMPGSPTRTIDGDSTPSKRRRKRSGSSRDEVLFK